MIAYLARRLVYMVITLLAVSVVSFVIVQSAPGDFAEIYAARKAVAGAIISQTEIENLRVSLGLDQPWHVQYWRWFTNIVLRNDWGMSWEWKRPVGEVIWERMPLTLGIAFSTLFFMYAISIPVGIYSAVRRYSVGDHVVSIVGYLGLATPNFLLALVLMYLTQKYFGQSVGGLFSPQFQNAPWSWARVVDLLAHLAVPVVVLGLAGTAFLIRAMRTG
jgi:peptide/nickel transport system permease protein